MNPAVAAGIEQNGMGMRQARVNVIGRQLLLEIQETVREERKARSIAEVQRTTSDESYTRRLRCDRWLLR